MGCLDPARRPTKAVAPSAESEPRAAAALASAGAGAATTAPPTVKQLGRGAQAATAPGGGENPAKEPWSFTAAQPPVSAMLLVGTGGTTSR
mmetsp:Transcript_81167/g.224643  ORF Transcript_81167/g.224643 Transcript_81167/m.224643 type:complete len:91 (-) Transcript_81167:501-773(-)